MASFLRKRDLSPDCWNFFSPRITQITRIHSSTIHQISVILIKISRIISKKRISLIRVICGDYQMSDLLQMDDAAGELSAEVGVEAHLHEEAAAEGLALEVMFALAALELVELVSGIRV